LPTRPLRSPRSWCGRVPASPRLCAFCSRRSLALLDAGAEGRSLIAFGVLSSRLGVSLGGPSAKAGVPASARPTTSIRISSYAPSVRAWGRRLVFGALVRRVASRLDCRSPLLRKRSQGRKVRELTSKRRWVSPVASDNCRVGRGEARRTGNSSVGLTWPHLPQRFSPIRRECLTVGLTSSDSGACGTRTPTRTVRRG
jgi:hypothetical protein